MTARRAAGARLATAPGQKDHAAQHDHQAPHELDTPTGTGAAVAASGELQPGVPERLDAVVTRALAKEPDERQQSAAEFAVQTAGAIDLSPPPWAWANGAPGAYDGAETQPTAWARAHCTVASRDLDGGGLCGLRQC